MSDSRDFRERLKRAAMAGRLWTDDEITVLNKIGWMRVYIEAQLIINQGLERRRQWEQRKSDRH